MAFLSWHDRYLLGHAELDAQHRKLFELVIHFEDVVQMGLTAELATILGDLLRSASDHFRFEEALMAQVGFPEVSEHQKVHGELIRQLQQMADQMRTGGHLSTKSVIRFLVDWLTNHHLREDMALKPFLSGSTGGSAVPG